MVLYYVIFPVRSIRFWAYMLMFIGTLAFFIVDGSFGAEEFEVVLSNGTIVESVCIYSRFDDLRMKFGVLLCFAFITFCTFILKEETQNDRMSFRVKGFRTNLESPAMDEYENVFNALSRRVDQYYLGLFNDFGFYKDYEAPLLTVYLYFLSMVFSLLLMALSLRNSCYNRNYIHIIYPVLSTAYFIPNVLTFDFSRMRDIDDNCERGFLPYIVFFKAALVGLFCCAYLV